MCPSIYGDIIEELFSLENITSELDKLIKENHKLKECVAYCDEQLEFVATNLALPDEDMEAQIEMTRIEAQKGCEYIERTLKDIEKKIKDNT